MSIPVQCAGCQAHFAAPEALAGKRAKCKQCGTVVEVPNITTLATTGLTPLPEPSDIPKPKWVQPPTSPAKPTTSPGIKLHHASASAAPSSQPAPQPVLAAATATSDEPSPLPSRLVQFVPVACTLGLAFVTSLGIVFLVGGLVGWLLAAMGIVAAVVALLFSLGRVPIAAWVVCVLYGLVCLFAGGGYTVLAISQHRQVAVSHDGGAGDSATDAGSQPGAQSSSASQSDGSGAQSQTIPQAVPIPIPVTPPAPKYAWPMATGKPPWRARTDGKEIAEEDEPVPPGPRKLADAKIRFVDWQVEVDPAPDEHLIGDGNELKITVPDTVRGDDVYLPNGYGSALAFNDTRKNEIEVWDLKHRRRMSRIALPSGYVTSGSIGPDGSYVAAFLTIYTSSDRSGFGPAVRTDGSQATLHVWSTLDPTVGCDIPLDDRSRRPEGFGFASPDILYVARGATAASTRPGEESVERKADVKLYDARTGMQRGELDLTNVNLKVSHLTPTPGGRFLFMSHGQPVFWDSMTGRIAGKVRLPRNWNCEMASFSAAGDQLAMLLFDDERKSHFGVWDLRTQELKVAHDDGDQSLSTFGYYSSQPQIAWLNNDEGWICQQRQLNATGEAQAQFSYPLSQQYARKLFDANQLLTGESLSNDYKSLRLGKFEAARLKPVALGNRNTLPSFEAFPDALDRAEHRSAGPMPLPYEELLAGDPSTWRQHWLYCTGLERPTVGLRWGVGVNIEVSGRNAQAILEPQLANREGLQWLSREVGPVGLQLVDALRRRGEAGQWGKYVDITDTRLREVVILGGGNRAQLNNSARLASVDVAVLIRLETVVKGREKDASMTLEIVDMATNKKVWESKPLYLSRASQIRDRGQDPVSELVAQTGEFIDKKLMLTPLSTMPRATITARAESAPLHRCNSLAGLAELMLYDHHKTITKEVAIAGYMKLVGKDTEAQILAGSDLAAKKTLIEKYAQEW